LKALSLKQLWAELILQLRKRIELRKGNTKFMWGLSIYSSLTSDGNVMKRCGFKELPLGFIVGKANLIDVKHYADKDEFNKDKSLHLANSDFVRYDFILKDIKRIEFIPAKGQLNFWEFNLS